MQRPDVEQIGADNEVSFWKQAVDRQLHVLMAPIDRPEDRVCLAMQAGLMKGKRVRALMLIGVCQGLGLNPVRLLNLACALEMVHAASLFIDDLPCTDNAYERRGQPALHVRFGESTALLASIGMLTHAFKTVAETEGIPVHLKAQLVGMLADTVGPNGLIRGQYCDLASGVADTDAVTLHQVNELKTGILFRTAMVMPALVSEADPATVDMISRLATDIGHAFQLRDDLEDSRDATDGSRVDRDGHATLVTALGPHCAKARFDSHLQQARQLIETLFREPHILTSLVSQLADTAAVSRSQGGLTRPAQALVGMAM